MAISSITNTNEFIKWKQLHDAVFSFNQSFQLTLNDDTILSAEKMLRLVPKKRMVVLGKWNDKNIVAKLFFDSQHARRHQANELRGANILKAHHIPSPLVLNESMSADRRTYVVIYEEISNAKSLAELWQQKKSIETMLPLLKSIVIELATQHVYGIKQDDLHLNNFLIADKIIYILDGAEISATEGLLSKKMSMQNLALFLSQLGAGMKAYHDILFHHYARSRGWILKNNDFDDLLEMIEECHQKRWLQYSKKIYRQCSSFQCIKKSFSFSMIDRQYLNEEMKQFLVSPDSFFSKDNVTFLKKGGSSTVIKTKMGNQEVVIKRYNIKHPWHFLKRCLRPSRAFTCWKMANKMRLFYIPTTKPIAFIEKRLLGFRYTSYFITEFLPGTLAQHYFSNPLIKEDKKSFLLKRLAALITQLKEMKMSHGDLKLTNIIIRSDDVPHLIDLDGTQLHRSSYALNKCFKKDVNRFLDNFKDEPVKQKQIKDLI